MVIDVDSIKPLQTTAGQYHGRFAPSPSGPLHAGSLVTALASCLEAKTHQGLWSIRIDDLDPQRSSMSCADQQLRLLDQLGFEWDSLSYQSQHDSRYDKVLTQLYREDLAYACECSRKAIHSRCDSGILGPVYDGYCRLRGLPTDDECYAARLRLDEPTLVTVRDAIQGDFSLELTSAVGDYLIKRSDAVFSYHLACVVDDYYQGITHVVRGYDLLSLTPIHIHLQQTLKLPTPHYAHVPLVLTASKQKLSKSQHARALTATHAVQLLWYGLDFLGQKPPKMLLDATIAEVWSWAKAHWNGEHIPKNKGIICPWLV